MKKMMLPMLFMTFFIAISGCKKDGISKENIRGKIVGKWTFLSEEYPSDFASPGETKLLIQYGKPGDYFLFGADGKLTYVMYGMKNNTTYTIESNGQIKLDGYRYNIDKLTDNKLELSFRNDPYDDTKITSYNFTK